MVREDIERSARSMYNSLKLERELQDQGIPLFATDEPFNIEGINATTVLVRRVKQGVDEILSNPRYTGHQVMGRRRRKGGKKIWTPPDEWIWTPEPTHPALVDKATWDKAQWMSTRSPSTPHSATPPARPSQTCSPTPAPTTTGSQHHRQRQPPHPKIMLSI